MRDRRQSLSARISRRPEALASLVLALIVTAPLLRPGFTLVYDMVFVPKPHFNRAMLGLSPIAPRSVPTGLAVALLSRALTGQVVQKVALFGIFALAAFGAARLVQARHWAARVAAGVLYAWNPLLFERILLGHWALLLGYALLPWVVKAALALRRVEPGAGWRLVLALAATVVASPYAGVIGAAIAAAVVLAPPHQMSSVLRNSAIVFGAAAAVNLPWLVPGLLHPDGPGQPGLAQFLFKARSDSPLGTLGSLASLGGLWRTDLAPPGRGTVAWIPVFLLIAALAVIGWRSLMRVWPSGAVWGLLGVSAAGLLLAWAPSVLGLDQAVLWLSKTLPGGGFLRDSQKFVIPLSLSLSIGFGMAVERILSIAPTGKLRLAFVLLLPLLPVGLAPTLAWGAGGRLTPVAYPSAWDRVEEIQAADPAKGAMLVLPWHAYLPFSWNEGRVVSNPSGQYFSRRAVTNTAIEVGRFRLSPEDPWTTLADPLIRADGAFGGELPRIGVRYVLLFKTADWRSFPARLQDLDRVLDAPDLSLYRGVVPSSLPSFPTPPPALVVAADTIAVGVFLAAFGATVRRRIGSGNRWEGTILVGPEAP
jgi:hypothetical protein